MGYAYRDKYGYVHVVEARTTAEQFARGAILETNIPYGGGYPQISVSGKDDLQDVIADVEEKTIFVGGNIRNGKKVNLNYLPTDLQAILVELGYSK